MFCIIVQNAFARPYRFYTTRDAALRAAQRVVRRHKYPVHVAWCKPGYGPPNPKVWMAFVSPETGTYRTDYWSSSDKFDCWFNDNKKETSNA